MRPIIFCIVGESGSGKTMLAEALEELAGIHLIQSYTDRPKRHENETGHTFLSVEEFDKLKDEDKIAKTEWNGYRYCCLKSDVRDISSYVIDCSGLEMLRKNFDNEYDIFAIRIIRPIAKRIKSVGNDRVARDHGKFYLSDKDFDFVYLNKSDSKHKLVRAVWKFVWKVFVEQDNMARIKMRHAS